MTKTTKRVLLILAGLLVCGAVVFFALHTKRPEAASIGIIGGADGPTAIFVAGPLELKELVAWGKILFAGLALLAGGIVLAVHYLKRKK